MQAWTEKQREYWHAATHRWNVKSGATRSGKTYLDYFMIPRRIRDLRGKDGAVVLLGNTQGTLRRNIIEPLQKIWGADLVGNIRSDNKVYLFGEWAHALGADKVTQVDRLRGIGIKYCYGDEIVTWHPEVFQMLKSRLDKPYSCFDGTCNPDGPTHWFKTFLDSDADVYSQTYSVYDNDFLDQDVITEMETEYAGTVFFDRYLLGKWTRAEGLIYQVFADNEASFHIDKSEIDDINEISIGIDFGGNRSNHAFVAVGFDRQYQNLYVLRSQSIPAAGISVVGIIDALVSFVSTVEAEFGRVNYFYADSAEQAIINTIRHQAGYPVRNSIKNRIIDRIRGTSVLLNTGRLKMIRGNNNDLANGLREAVWNQKHLDDERLDDGTSDIDILDAFEYAFEYRLKMLLRSKKDVGQY